MLRPCATEHHVQVVLLLLGVGVAAGATRERSWEEGLPFRLRHEWMAEYEPAVYGYHARTSACLTELVSLALYSSPLALYSSPRSADSTCANATLCPAFSYFNAICSLALGCRFVIKAQLPSLMLLTNIRYSTCHRTARSLSLEEPQILDWRQHQSILRHSKCGLQEPRRCSDY